jgi:hypothetical protein
MNLGFIMRLVILDCIVVTPPLKKIKWNSYVDS